MKLLQKKILLLSPFDLYFVPVSMFLVSIVYLIATGHVKEVSLIFLSSLSFLISVLIKLLYKVPRPEGYKPKSIRFANNYSFPSGHTMFYFVFFSTWAYIILTRQFFSPLITFICVFLSFFLSTFIGISRVVIGAHTVKDVVGGYVFGILFLSCIVLIDILLFI